MQTSFRISIPNINNPETTESAASTEVSETLKPNGSALIPDFDIPMKVPKKTIRNNSDTYNDPDTSEKFASQDYSLGASYHQFQLQTTATLLFSAINKAQSKKTLFNLFTYFISHSQIILTLTTQPKRSHDHTIMLNDITATVPALSRPPLVLLIFADTYWLTSTNYNPFQTYTKLYATTNPSQTIFQPHAATNIGPSARLLISSSIPIVKPINLSPVKPQHRTISFVAMNKIVKSFDGLTFKNHLNKFYIK